MSIYFDDFVTTVSTLMICAAIYYMIHTAVRCRQIEFWGRPIAVLASFGLLLCCFAAARDSYHLSVQASFDASVTAGIFAIDSIQSTICCIGGAVIAFSVFSSIIVKNQKYRKMMFFVLCSTVIVKILIIEISRWLL